MKRFLLFAGLLMLSGCAGLSDGSRKAKCALDDYCVQSPLCDNLEGLTLKQVEEKFDANGDEKPSSTTKQYHKYSFQKEYSDRRLTLVADIYFKDTKDGLVVNDVDRCELRRPNTQYENQMRGDFKSKLNKIERERN